MCDVTSMHGGEHVGVLTIHMHCMSTVLTTLVIAHACVITPPAVANGYPFGSVKQETSYTSGKRAFIAKSPFYKPSEFSEDLSGKFICRMNVVHWC